jgi:hypothetical protein
MKIAYEEGIGDIKTLLVERVEEFKSFFPGWVNELHVYFDDAPKDSGDIAACESKYEYRTVGLTFYPRFLTAKNWQNTMLHELQHVIFRPYVAHVERIIDTFVKDEAVAEFLKGELTDSGEMLAEDMAIFAEKLLERQKTCQCTSSSAKNVDTKPKN